MRRRLTALLALLVVAQIPTIGIAGPTASAAPGDPGAIVGTIFDGALAATDQGGNSILATNTVPGPFGMPQYVQGTIEADGTYRIPEVPAGTYRVQLGSLYNAGESVVFHPGVGNAFDATVLTVSTTEVTADIVLPSGSITGTAEVDGVAITGTLRHVFVAISNLQGGNQIWAQVDATGGYSFARVPDGDYELTYNDDAAGSDIEPSTNPHTIHPGNRAITVDLDLPATGQVSGTIRNSSGVGIAANLTLIGVGADGPGLYLAMSSNGAGAYTSPQVAVGEYIVQSTIPSTVGAPTPVYAPSTLDFDDAAHATVTAAGNSTLDLQFPATGTIGGTVRDGSGVGVSGAAVHIYTADGLSRVEIANTDANGVYQASVIADRAYLVEFRPPTGSGLVATYFGGPTAAVATPVTPTAAFGGRPRHRGGGVGAGRPTSLSWGTA